jgi:glucose-6-phosphate isomerase
MTSWPRFKKFYYQNPELGVALDISRIPFPEGFFGNLEKPMQKAFVAMAALEKGAIANNDEKRMVGHYWLRAPQLAPTRPLTLEIESTLAEIAAFVGKVHSGAIAGPRGRFTQLLVIGIGGSALGPQFVCQALGRPGADKMAVSFFDNTDPDGFDSVLSALSGRLPETLAVVISKSGGTAETRNGQLEAAKAFRSAGLDAARHFVAVTGAGSKLDQTAVQEGWLARFPMWDWVGGRTSEFSAVGLLPAALQGIDIQGMIAGAAAMDVATRRPVSRIPQRSWPSCGILRRTGAGRRTWSCFRTRTASFFSRVTFSSS